MENFSNEGFMLFLNSKIGEEQSAEDAEDGPPELLVCIRLNIICTLDYFLISLSQEWVRASKFCLPVISKRKSRRLL